MKHFHCTSAGIIINNNNQWLIDLTVGKYIPAASACFDIVLNDVGFKQLGVDTVAAVADLKRVTIGLSPPS